MTAERVLELDRAEEQDFWQQQGDMWIRVHVRARRCLYDPRREPSQESEIENGLADYPVRFTEATAADGSTKEDFQDNWLETGNNDVTDLLGGPWRGYTYFLRSAPATEESAVEPESSTALFVTFDTEDKARRVLTKGQKRQLAECTEAASRKDAAMWSQLSSEASFHNSRKMLPRGCRHFLLELFSGVAALTMMAGRFGIPFSNPVDLQDPNGNLEDSDVRDRLWARIEAEDPYFLVVAPNGLPWSLPPTRRNKEQQEARRRWYPVARWLADLFKSRLAKGRQVALESSWGSPLWEMKCFRETYGAEDVVTNEVLEVIPYDQGTAGFKDRRTGQVCQKTAGLMTASGQLKRAMVEYGGGIWNTQLSSASRPSVARTSHVNLRTSTAPWPLPGKLS